MARCFISHQTDKANAIGTVLRIVFPMFTFDQNSTSFDTNSPQ